MAEYTINQFSKITGLNKILIRTWENRYNFIEPRRTSTNIRLYDENMLNLGIKYAILVENGYKISKLVNYEKRNLDSLIEKTLQISENNENKNKIYIARFIESAILFDQDLFEKTYAICIKRLGLVNFYKDILIRTMNRISILYLNSKISPGNEHFLSENIRIKLAYEIGKKDTATKGDLWVLFLPENEYHDIGLLFTYLILKIKKQRVIYLGQNVPRESLIELNKQKVNFLFFINTKRQKDFTKNLYNYINNKNCKIYVIDKFRSLENKYSNFIKISNINKFLDLFK